MHLLVLADTYSTDGTSPWLVEDLVHALVRQGHTVDVLVKDMAVPRPRGLAPRNHPGVSIYSVGVTSEPSSRLARRTRLPLAMARLRTSGVRWARGRRYDAVVYTSIAWTKARVPKAVRRSGEPVRVLVYWDFFPVHQREIGHFGRLPRALDPVLHRIERAAVRDADVVALMTPKNIDYFTSYFGAEGQSLVLLPPWGSDQAIGLERGVGREAATFTAVFGGQLTKGRGLEELAAAAKLLLTSDPEITIDVYGDGPMAAHLASRIAGDGLHNLVLRGRVARGEYAAALQNAHCGIAATVDGVTVPTFPSKIVDYASAGIPVVVASECSGDVGDWVESHGAGIAVPAGDPAALADALRSVHALWQERARWHEMAARSRACYDSELSADVAARRVIEAVNERRAAAGALRG